MPAILDRPRDVLAELVCPAQPVEVSLLGLAGISRSPRSCPVLASMAARAWVRLWISAPITIIQHVLSIDGSRLSGPPADSLDLGRSPGAPRVAPAVPDGGERHNGRRSGPRPTDRLRASPSPGRTQPGQSNTSTNGPEKHGLSKLRRHDLDACPGAAIRRLALSHSEETD